MDGKPPNVKDIFRRVQKLVAERQAELANAGAAGQQPAKVLSLSQQAAGILLKVVEVDAFVRQPPGPGETERQSWLFEVHPEMCFRAMNDDEVSAAKTSAHGQLERLALVRREFPDAEDRIRAWPDGARQSLLDICDAYAACWTALRWARTGCGAVDRRAKVEPPLEVLGEDLPGEPPREAGTGLLMRMVV